MFTKSYLYLHRRSKEIIRMIKHFYSRREEKGKRGGGMAVTDWIEVLVLYVHTNKYFCLEIYIYKNYLF